jgi:DNA topoisomerase-1
MSDGLTAASVAELYGDPEACATAAGLVYVSWEEPGIRRQRRGRGFTYLDARGVVVTSTRVRERIAALAIPPAWTGVWIASRDDAHLLAVGEDDRGRRQYLYHERWRAIRDQLNFHRLVLVGESLPAVREHVERQLRRRTLDRDRVLAALVRIVDLTAVRIGNAVYAEENESFGLTTLSRRHVTVEGARIRLRFPAKSGKQADVTVTDRPAARVVEELLHRRGRRLFAVEGTPVDGAEVNALLGELTEAHVTAKDFRTWTATHTAFRHLEEHLDSDDPEKTVIAAVDAAAEALDDTRAVTRAHYVHPQVLDAFLDGTFAAWRRTPPGQEPYLADSERRLLAFLRAALAQAEVG